MLRTYLIALSVLAAVGCGTDHKADWFNPPNDETPDQDASTSEGQHAGSGAVAAPDKTPTKVTATGGWSELVTAHAPPPRSQFAMTYDSARDRVVVFSGYANGSSVADMWEFDGKDWAEIEPLHMPPARRDASMTYDSARKRVVLFGGTPDGTAVLGDTWEYDGKDWARSAANGPEPRRYMRIVFDSKRKRSVLFGGADASDKAIAGTWEFDGIEWTYVATMHQPGKRRSYAAIFDESRGKVLIHGGAGDVGSTSEDDSGLDDVWLYDGHDWSQLVAKGPSPRWYQSLAYFPGGVTILYGGWARPVNYFDTWQLKGSTWSAISVTKHPNAARGHAMIYDPKRKRGVLFGGSGGEDADGMANETWIFKR